MKFLLAVKKYGHVYLLLLACLTALLLAEFVLRLYSSKTEMYHGAVHGGDLQNPQHKILILGDSFLAPHGDKITLHQFLDQEFKKKSVEFLNTAQPGFGPIDYWIQLQAYISLYRPEKVILFYYAGNDLTNVQYRVENPQQLKQRLKPFLTHSVFFNFLNAIRDRWAKKDLPSIDFEKDGVLPERVRYVRQNGINPYFLTLALEKPEYILDNLLMKTDSNHKAWKGVQAYLERIRMLTQKTGSEFVVIMLPSTVQVNHSHFEFYRNLGFNVSDETLGTDVPQQEMTAYCIEKEIKCYDLLPAFREQTEEEFYLPNDDHLSIKGAYFAAHKSIEFLEAG